MAHFYANPAACLTLAFDGANDSSVADDAVNLASYIRSVPSFRDLIQKQVGHPALATETRRLLEDDTRLLVKVEDWRQEKLAYSQRLVEAWKLLDCLQDMLAETKVAQEVVITEYYKNKLVERAIKGCQALR